MNILRVENLVKKYGSGANEVKALNDVSFNVEQGEFLAVVGTSGSGKSTLLHCLGGLDKLTSGKIIIDGKDISQLGSEELTIFRRRKIGFVFQQFNLITNLSVYENIILPVQLDNQTPDKKYVETITQMLGINGKLNFMPTQLSGGQQQRVAIARALCSKPAILLCDEPTGNLDSKTTVDVLNLLENSAKQFSQTIIMITHNDDIASSANRKIRIEDGRIVG